MLFSPHPFPPPIWLASDIHLQAGDALTLRFLSWLERATQQAGSVILLGDLFDAWIGDDDLAAPLSQQVVAALYSVGSTRPLYLMQGNRDFLLGAAFANAAAATLLDDPCCVDLAGTPTLLTHGDALCTDDAAYQQFRAQVRGSTWRDTFLARTLDERRVLAHDLRQASEQAKRDKPMTIMDVNATAVAALVAQHGVPRLIHGHTHRPACHHETASGRQWQRWVLPDWTAAAGGYLQITHNDWRLLPA